MDVYDIGYKHAIGMLERNGAKIKGELIEIPEHPFKTVPLEVGFEGHYPKERENIGLVLDEGSTGLVLDFEGNGFVIKGRAYNLDRDNLPDYTFNLELVLDGKLVEKFPMPTRFQSRKLDVAWKYQLSEGKHQIEIRILNPAKGYQVQIHDLTTYTSDSNQIGYKND